nr:netrin receptor DCC-like [Lytechinus pictus]
MPRTPVSLLTGDFYCTTSLKNSLEDTIRSRSARVTLATLGEVRSPFGVTVYPGDTARFECEVNGTVPKVTTWLKDGQLIDLTEERYASRYTLLPSGALEIRDVREGDAGRYRCKVESPLLPNERRRSNSAGLVVMTEPAPARRPEDLAFLVAPGPSPIEALIGSTITLEAATTEPATLEWYKGEKKINMQGDHYRRLGQGSLQITNLGEIDTGIYRVVATSKLDQSTVERGVRVVVQVPPIFLDEPTNRYARLGTTEVLQCTVYGIPTPTIKWKKNGIDVDVAEDFYRIDDRGGLEISGLQEEDSGIYQCLASNLRGNIQSTAELIVLPDGKLNHLLPLERGIYSSYRTLIISNSIHMKHLYGQSLIKFSKSIASINSIRSK